MGEDGIHPREDTFNTLMDGALQNNDPQLVPQLFRQLVNLQLNPGSLSYTALITALARLSQPEAAVRILLSLGRLLTSSSSQVRASSVAKWSAGIGSWGVEEPTLQSMWHESLGSMSCRMLCNSC